MHAFAAARAAAQKASLEEEKKAWEAERAKRVKVEETEKLQYSKLLRKYNQLIAKARQHGVTPGS
jgi:hypothetical protein